MTENISFIKNEKNKYDLFYKDGNNIYILFDIDQKEFQMISFEFKNQNEISFNLIKKIGDKFSLKYKSFNLDKEEELEEFLEITKAKEQTKEMSNSFRDAVKNELKNKNLDENDPDAMKFVDIFEQLMEDGQKDYLKSDFNQYDFMYKSIKKMTDEYGIKLTEDLLRNGQFNLNKDIIEEMVKRINEEK